MYVDNKGDESVREVQEQINADVFDNVEFRTGYFALGWVLFENFVRFAVLFDGDSFGRVGWAGVVQIV